VAFQIGVLFSPSNIVFQIIYLSVLAYPFEIFQYANIPVGYTVDGSPIPNMLGFILIILLDFIGFYLIVCAFSFLFSKKL
jgi:hypothetical protein